MLFDEEMNTIAAEDVEFAEDVTVWLPNSSTQVLSISRIGNAKYPRTLCMIGYDFENNTAVQLLIPAAMQLEVLE